MRKKTVTILLTIVLVLALVGVAVAAVTTVHEPNFSISTSASGALDNGAALTVTVSNNKGLALDALTFHADFNEDALQVTDVTFTVNGTEVSANTDGADLSVTDGAVSGGGHSTVGEANESGTVGFYYMNVTDAGDALTANKDKVQAVIKFKVKADQEAGDVSISLYEDSVSSTSWFDLREKSDKTPTATVTLSGENPPYTLGDVNVDGKIDVDDVLACLDLCFVEPTQADLQKADIDKSGTIDVDDVLLCLDLCF